MYVYVCVLDKSPKNIEQKDKRYGKQKGKIR